LTSSKIILATRNAKKGRELRRLLRGVKLRVLTLDQFPAVPPVREDKPTLRENAVKKAVRTSSCADLPVLADDSGLEVYALGGRPGVRSARFAGPAQDDRANIAKVLRELEGLSPSRRRARFVCVLALAERGRLVRTFRGVCEGSIAREPAGRAGFGYDPVFIPEGRRRTLAELGPRVKDALSHRTRAVQAFARWLEERPRGARS
jgi:XTP/dITP diphosphohydrolase